MRAPWANALRLYGCTMSISNLRRSIRLRDYDSAMSALPPKADIRRSVHGVCFVPIADIGRTQSLIDDRGRDAKLIDWLDEITADCPKKIAHNMNDPCGARCPDLPKVL
jgi:hypothetical protein